MKIILFGSGQGGQMAARWLPASWELLAIADNDTKKWGAFSDGIPIIDPAGIAALAPDLVLITVLNQEAADAIEVQLRTIGYAGAIRTLKPFREIMDLRLAHLRLLVQEIETRKLPGAVAELGVYRGDFAAEINRLFPDRTLYLFDTFSGFPPADMETEQKVSFRTRVFAKDFRDTSVEHVFSRLPYPHQAVFCPGRFPDTLPENLPPLVFVSLDPDLYAPTLAGLQAFWPKLVPGGILLIHDYNSAQFPGVGQAVRTFCDNQHLMVLPLPDLHGSAVLIKQS